MQPENYQFLKANEERLAFIRLNPEWYRKLAREPGHQVQFDKEMKHFFGKTPIQRVEKVGNQLQMVNMLIQMAKVMKEE
ncbi:YlbE-like protein [Thalassobacillus cyri]|uniref:YlbE-like protein n=1 Tax=Thalassobacillus cyri TaxID=571932 RepID=A0A1H4H6S9_9BACI|nr:YlbE-like family protein [Thalassobacillus cyri]SEB17120.1 YlbE-like protein [Thalassobacillus cyri]